MKALYIVGDSRSGSSLLQHLLAQQDTVTALGEVHRVDRLIRAGELCACGRPIRECSFWRQLAQQAGLNLEQAGTAPEFRPWRHRLSQLTCWTACKFGVERPARILLKQERKSAENCFALYGAASELAGSQIVVDSSKTPAQFLRLYMYDESVVRPVLLVRDGRAVVWSKLQRKKNLGVVPAVRAWLTVSRMMFALRHILPEADRHFVYYEDLCRNPGEVVAHILSREGIYTESRALEHYLGKRHHIGGSPHFRASVPEQICIDERWRTEMPKETLATFERIAGRMNRKLGYE